MSRAANSPRLSRFSVGGASVKQWRCPGCTRRANMRWCCMDYAKDARVLAYPWRGYRAELWVCYLDPPTLCFRPRACEWLLWRGSIKTESWACHSGACYQRRCMLMAEVHVESGGAAMSRRSIVRSHTLSIRGGMQGGATDATALTWLHVSGRKSGDKDGILALTMRAILALTATKASACDYENEAAATAWRYCC